MTEKPKPVRMYAPSTLYNYRSWALRLEKFLKTLPPDAPEEVRNGALERLNHYRSILNMYPELLPSDKQREEVVLTPELVEELTSTVTKAKIIQRRLKKRIEDGQKSEEANDASKG